MKRTFLCIFAVLVLVYAANTGPGYYYDVGSDQYLDCPKAYRCPGDGEKYACFVDTVAPGTASTCTICESSQVQNADQSECVDCSSTLLYINTSVSPRICASCADGWWCDGVDRHTCSSGNWCAGGIMTSCNDYEVAPTGSNSCTLCTSPEFPSADRSACTTCDPTQYGTATGCEECSVGHFCNGTTQTECPSGQIAPAGQTSCTPCSLGAGWFPNADDSECVECGPTQYGDGEGCHDCIPGYECNGSTKTACVGNEVSPGSTSYCYTCAVHTYANADHSACDSCDSTEFDNGTACEACPIGHMCDGITKTACTGNTASPGSSTTCDPCPEHQYTNATWSLCEPCGPTEYDDGTQCAVCPPGHTCDGVTATPCDPGWVALEGSSTCTECAAGLFRSPDHSTCVTCTAAQYGDLTNGCMNCPAGYGCDGTTATACVGTKKYSPADHGICEDCPVGEFALPDHSECEPCVTPTEWNNTTECVNCPEGHECDNLTKTPCGAGYISGEGIGVCTPCNNGYYANATQSQCDACPSGSGTPLTGAYASEDDCDPCGPGYASVGGGPCIFCESGLTTKKKDGCRDVCPDGQYLDEDGCTSCPQGFYCTMDIKFECVGNTYSNGNAGSCDQCVNGFVNDDHSGCVTDLCPDGEYFSPGEPAGGYVGNVVGSAVEGLCLPCPRGAVCKSGRFHHLGIGDYESQSIITTELFASSTQSCSGYTVDGKTSCRSCTVAGEYYDQQTSQCLKCPAGFACPAGADDPIACRNTQYQPLVGQSSCIPCSTFSSVDGVQCIKCISGMYPNLVTKTCMPCPIGHRCSGTGQPESCPTNQYQPHTGRGACKTCAHEKFINIDRSSCVACEPGEYFNIAADRCVPCPAGYECVGNYATRCSPGDYAPPKSAACLACNDGFVSADQDKCIRCEPGDYVNRHTENCEVCPKGHACPYGLNKEPCFGGYESETGRGYQDSFGRVECDEPCVEPMYLAHNGTFCTQCENGKYASDREECEPCPAGFYCKNSQRFPCPRLTYSGSGNSDRCYSCDNGLTNARQTTCTPCPEGQYMDPSSGVATCRDCPAGFYCTNGYRIECPAKMWSTAKEKKCLQCPGGIVPTSRTKCTICDPGTYPNENQDHCDACPAGHYCVGGTKYECLTNYYAPKGSSKCFKCENGYVSYDMDSCLSGVSAYADRAVGSLSDGEFWAVGVVWAVILLIFICIHSIYFGCMCWPKKLIDVEWSASEKARKATLDEADKKRQAAAEAAKSAYKRTKSGKESEIRMALAEGEITGKHGEAAAKLESIVANDDGSLDAKTRGAAVSAMQKRGGMRGMIRARARGMRGVPRGRPRRVTSTHL